MKENRKTINILSLDDNYSSRAILQYFVDDLKSEHKKYRINFFHTNNNERAIKAMKKMKNIHILITDQNRQKRIIKNYIKV